MITVVIDINGHTKYARSARNVGEAAGGKCAYRLDTGDELLHDPKDGAVVLAKMMLDTVREPK